ncbi:hypothetical protein CLU82_2990 [Flavobacterium sp. 5]|nr:hypothetical protein CLU82_2990 [Flavobacterium sp. 5]
MVFCYNSFEWILSNCVVDFGIKIDITGLFIIEF